MTYLDAVAIDYRAHEFAPRQLVAALIYLVIGNEKTMAVFPNYYQMAVQFTVNPPIPEQTPQLEVEEHKDQIITPAVRSKRQKSAPKLDNLCPQIVYYNEKVFAPFLE